VENFWDYSVWSGFNLIAVLLASLLAANILRRCVGFLRNSLIPASVLGGGILILIVGVYKAFTGDILFDTEFFGGSGTNDLEVITYHTLALGFIASAFKPSKTKLTKKRTVEIFNTGVTTVSTYLLQAVFGLGISIVAAMLVSGFFPAAGILLPFGYGQGTGQALNYGGIFENDFGFSGGKSFGLTIAALGFLSASIGGVIHLNMLKRKGKIKLVAAKDRALRSEEIQSDDEIPMQESIDKMTIQIALIAVAYMLAYLLMWALGLLLPGLKSVIYGFNFLLGVLTATLVKLLMGWLKKKHVLKKEYTNSFLMTRASNFFFDIMVVAGIAAIRFSVLKDYWGIILIMGVVGLVITYIYNYYVAKKLFPEYAEEQFLTMYGMLTGTASTGVILLREIDGDFKTPALDNLVYQNFPAIVFGFPMMLLATLAPVRPVLTLLILVVFFVVMNVILFRSRIFKRRGSE
jgi:ESS family glutamate:Na+ symporter